MTRTFKVLSALLCYPDEGLQEAAGELAEALDAEALLAPAERARIRKFCDELAKSDLMDAQEHYVDLFDRTRALSLHLFEHVHGESRDRGSAMVSLIERYQEAGLAVAAQELPDYLPLFLEFLSLLPREEAISMLAEPVHIIAALGERIAKRRSSYAVIFEALTALAGKHLDPDELSELRAVEIDDPMDLAALDKAWEESEIKFGPGDANSGDDCPRVARMLDAMEHPRPASPRSPVQEGEVL
jgi:nitrate reductase delta subunit